MPKYFITNNWNQILEKIGDFDLYFYEEYFDLYTNNENIKSCFVYINDEEIFLFPFIKSKIPNTDFWDFESPYGYGGPLSNSNKKDFLNEAFHSFYTFMKENKFISGFIRFHPLLNNHNLLPSKYIFQNRKIVSILLDDKFESFMIKKNKEEFKIANKNDFEFIVDFEFKFLSDFIKIYNETMDKLNASNFYYFKESYFIKIKESLKNKAFLTLLFKDGNIVAGFLIFINNNIASYHLSASSSNYLKLYPNQFLMYKTSKYLLDTLNIKFFNLGGGNNEDENNTLLRYKKRFSDNIHTFYIGKIIINEDIYKELNENWSRIFFQDSYKNYFMKWKIKEF